MFVKAFKGRSPHYNDSSPDLGCSSHRAAAISGQGSRGCFAFGWRLISVVSLQWLNVISFDPMLPPPLAIFEFEEWLRDLLGITNERPTMMMNRPGAVDLTDYI